MVFSVRRAALAASAFVASAAARTLDPIEVKGSKFFYANGTQFYMKGIAYQQEAGGATGSSGTKYRDPLADEEACRKDVPLLAALDTNTIRTYAIDPTADHSVCMNLLNEAGIYVIADLGEPAVSINRNDPEWTVELFDRYKAVIDELGTYDNVIGFFSGNEVTNNNKNTDASAFVKAATRDTKAYIKQKMDNGHRWMGVGYAANDDADIRVDIAQYFNCGPEEEAIDYWGYNIYSWCGESSFTESGYDVQVDFFSNYSVPVFFAEYGCNAGGVEKRQWDDTVALYSDQMTGVFSGGIVYMYHQEANDYGLVEYKNGEPEPMKNYQALKTQMAKVDPSSTQAASYEPTNTAAACPPISKNWKVEGSALPPTPDSDLCNCMAQASTCVPKDGLSEKSYGDIFGTICGDVPEACAGIKTDAENGVYGPYSMCNAKEKLAHVLDAYYKDQGTDDACDFGGDAQIVNNPSSNQQCEAQLASASSQVEVAATATSAPESTGGSGSGDGEDAGASLRTPFVAIGEMAMGVYVLVAMGVGAGMLVL